MTAATLTPTIEASAVRTFGDPLEMFEQFRRHECRTDYDSFRPAEVEVPPIGENPEIRLLRYVENAEQVLNHEHKPTFRHWGWSSRGHIGFTPLRPNAVSTGTYYAGSVSLAINDRGELELAIQFADHGNESLAASQRTYVKEIQRFLEA